MMEGYTILSLLLCLSVASAIPNELRLAGEGSSSSQGRLEVYANGDWGTVCDDLWGLQDANVVCRQLGFPGASEYTAMAWPFGEGSGQINLDNVACVGDETSIMDCPQNEIGNHNCGHRSDAGVVCHEVRLAGSGSSANQGRVEVYANGEWGTVCDDSWGLEDANVVCRQLGFLGASNFTVEAETFGEGSGKIFMDNVACEGDEFSIKDCPRNKNGWHNCDHEEDAGVICQVQDNGATSEPAVVRLGGVNKQDDLGHGVVEVYLDGQWGTVCGIGWSQEDSNVVCKQLGFTDPAFLHYDSVWKFFGSGTGSTLLADVACTGEEASIMDCPAGSTGIPSSCTHEKDAEVQCLESDKKRKMEDLEFYEKGDMTEEEKVAAEERSNDKMDSDLKKKAVLEALVDLLVYLEDK
ncbi:neurotrypsin isoform X2 [Strongylocentrotus purpuratus]|uniref:SRCR domain-containing protein n=1 Tax=Strongylocentrotus purpuratus TaxID=7668 RepID=A0A7M7NW43_STRPU|nr:neurotrypsin isoform X2 [Strongylocentrotus purpuratus]